MTFAERNEAAIGMTRVPRCWFAILISIILWQQGICVRNLWFAISQPQNDGDTQMLIKKHWETNNNLTENINSLVGR